MVVFGSAIVGDSRSVGGEVARRARVRNEETPTPFKGAVCWYTGVCSKGTRESVKKEHASDYQRGMRKKKKKKGSGEGCEGDGCLKSQATLLTDD